MQRARDLRLQEPDPALQDKMQKSSLRGDFPSQIFVECGSGDTGDGGVAESLTAGGARPRKGGS